MAEEKYRVAYKCYSSKHVQNFDKEKISLTRCGKTFNLYDFIQSNREDTEIYPTLEKYGCIDRMQVTAEGTYKDITNAMDLRGLYDQEVELKNIFESLPLEERRYFNHDFYNFKENGLKYYEEKAQKEIAERQAHEQVVNTPKEEVIDNVKK